MCIEYTRGEEMMCAMIATQEKRDDVFKSCLTREMYVCVCVCLSSEEKEQEKIDTSRRVRETHERGDVCKSE